MCECGCLSMGEFFKLPGPKNIIYIIQKYPGCHNCDAPCGVSIRKIDKKIDKQEYDYYNETQALNFVGDKYYQTHAIGFCSQSELYKRLYNHFKEVLKTREDDEPFDDVFFEIECEEFSKEFFEGI